MTATFTITTLDEFENKQVITCKERHLAQEYAKKSKWAIINVSYS